MGIDFAGGVIVQVQFAQPVEDEVLKKSLDVPELPGISTQRFGEGTRDYLLRFSSAENTDAAALRTNVLTALAKAFPGNDVEIQRLEMVGPKVGDDLTNKALGALYYATLLIAVYISGRFEQRWMAGVAMAAVLWGGMYLAGLTGLSMGWLVLVALGITWWSASSSSSTSLWGPWWASSMTFSSRWACCRSWAWRSTSTSWRPC